MGKKVLYTAILSIFSLGLIILILFYSLGKTVNLVYYSDAKYLPYMMTSIYSAIENKKASTKYNIYVITQGYKKEDEENLQKLEQKNVKIYQVKATEKNLDYKHLGRFETFKPAMQKIFISDYLNNIDKVLYLDADTIIQQDLSELYNTDIEDVYISASRDGLMFMFPQHITEIGLNWRNFYFNSGVMLMNLKKIRQDNLIKQAIIFFHTHQEVFGDQDVFNVIVKDKVKEFSYKYNCNSTFFEENSAKFLSDFFKEDVPQTTREVYDNAVILHFAGHKPWTNWFNHSYLKPLWWEYANKTKAKYNIEY